MTTVIKVENLSKKYILNHKHQGERYTALRDVMTNSVKNLFRREQALHSNQEEFWALKDLNFEIKQGDRVGIIGRNGAGKSTLLKVLSRIVEPTAGKVKMKGRVASLLEVGTGFHPELTGRENIFLNGAILGMKRHEIHKKFDEIVSFAEVEKFLDTPVKRYSSGMYVRLAFSVAAHLDPEILIVDEVLAVGDAQFQAKCMGKMENVGKDGRTVLFVSHNMGAIQTLCDKLIVLRNGEIIHNGSVSSGLLKYSQIQPVTKTQDLDLDRHRPFKDLNREAFFEGIYFPHERNIFEAFGTISFRAVIKSSSGNKNLRISFTISTCLNHPVGSGFTDEILTFEPNESKEIEVTIRGAALVQGQYFLSIAVGKGSNKNSWNDFDILKDVLIFEVLPEKIGSSAHAKWVQGWGSVHFSDLTLKEL